MAKLPEFSSDLFQWKQGKGRGSLDRLDLKDFPRTGFFIRSTRTGKSQLFLPDSDTMVENEFFDGEASAYFAPAGGVTLQIWVGG